jgi:hypothetical protein
MRTRLRNVEVAFGKVDQRLLTLERVIIPVAEGYSVPPRERSRFAVGVCPRLAAQAA